MEHKTAIQTLFKVAAALLILLALTVGLSFVPLGPFSFAAALLIAAVKAALVVLFFMEVRFSDQRVWIMAAASLVWLFILLGGVVSDYATRVIIPPPF